ncbi:hypothetical protein FE257_012879 [Aspergillus nanangensis]|uniref:Ell binding protein Ebp1 C-terminal domain-containing protein n=1 Tax=Aspergillus nanangensis TaxID=2582783 RepID=A0AAD4CFR5_ASPNN|nr:hypothetical protein FE257_012879 [Aspergillus nanangensis]
MSVNPLSRSADDDLNSPAISAERQFASRQDPIDQRLKRLREEVLPFYPLLLTVPTDVPFRLGGRFVNNWAISDEGPFTPEEQQLQYMTFLTHHEGDSLLVAVGDWSDEAGNIMSDQRSGPQSAASTPSSLSLKKKITLSDYKNKRKSGPSASPLGREPAGQSSSTSHVLDDSQKIPKASPGEEGRSKARGLISSHNAVENIERKRPSQPCREPTMSRERDHANRTPAKRPRLTPDNTISSDKREPSKPRKLPALLSPTLPPTSTGPRLPRLLSPTLPPDIERELSKLSEEYHAPAPSQIKGLSGSEATKSKGQKAKNSNQSASQLGSTPGSTRNNASNSAHNKHTSTASDSRKSDSFVTTKADSTSHKGESYNVHGTSAIPRLIVKLKYGKPNKRRIEALLKFSGKRKGAPSRSPVKDPTDTMSSQGKKSERNARGNPTSSELPHSKSHRTDGKLRDVTGVPLRERTKEPKTQISEKPETPVSSTYTAHHQEKTKQTSTVLLKDQPDTGHRAETIIHESRPPSLQSTAKGAIGDPGTVTMKSPLQSNNQTSQVRNGERRAWKEEYQKYGNLGRELKHAAERRTSKDNVTNVEEKKAAATAIEAILCFVLAFVADDQSKLVSRQMGDSSSWQSILAYWRVVRKNSTPYPHLHNLCLILGAVSYETIHALDLERLAIIPLSGEQAALGGNGNLATPEDDKKNRKEVSYLKARLPEYYKESQKLWLEGSRGLNEDILAREFPKTWSGRSRNYSEQGKPQLKAGDYSGAYFLPMGKTNTPVETVRFAHAILKEWCAKEGVEWKGRLSL